MKQVPMKFKGYSWHHNPREIVFENTKQLNETLAPFDKSVVQNTGRHNMRISGEGELFGDDCIEQFKELLALFREGGSGVLSIENVKPFHAVFESLTLIGKPKPDVLTYRFLFREVMSEADNVPHTYTPGENENLWDVSYRFGIGIDALMALNPQVKRPDILTEGEVVRLC